MNNCPLYTAADQAEVTAERRKRMLLTYGPAALLLLVSVAIYVLFRLRHDESGWVWSALVTLAGGAYAVFLGDVYLRPVRLYKKHVDFMLGDRLRETTGTLTHMGDEPQDKNGLDCYALTVNVGEKADPKDDRLFYLDALKSPLAATVGERVHLFSGDGMVAGLERAPKET